MYDVYLSIVTSPLTWFAAGFALVLVVLQSVKLPEGGRAPQPGAWLKRHYWRMMIVFGLTLGVAAAIFYLVEIGVSVVSLVDRFRGAAQNPETPAEDIRNLATGVAVLLGALAAAATLVFQLVRVWTTERATTATEEGLVTDRINKAVEGLGAEKSVSRVAREVVLARDNPDSPSGKTRRIVVQWGEDVPDLEDGEDIDDFRERKALLETVPNLEVRIGAIYALERISQDSVRDHVQIMEILTAYVRENARAEDAGDFPEPEWQPLPDDASDEDRAAHLAQRQERFGRYVVASKAWNWAQTLKTRTDIQAALRVIGRRGTPQKAAEARDTRHGAKGYALDLRATCLQGCDLSGLDLDRALLQGARMEGADLTGARMEGAILAGARMEGAILAKARMEGATLDGARMEGAFLGGARLEGASLWEARLEGADLAGARLEGAFLGGARLEGASLLGARLEGASLRGARFDAGTNFAAAVVHYAAVKSCDLSKSNVNRDQVTAMFGDGSVTLPAGLARPDHWPDEDLEPGEFLKRWRAWQAAAGHAPRE